MERRDGVLVLAASGRIGHASAAALRAALDSAIDGEPAGLVLDCRRVDYVSSAGLTAIDAASARLVDHGATLVLCGLSSPVRIALDLAGLLPRIPIEPTRDLAVARMRSRATAIRPS